MADVPLLTPTAHDARDHTGVTGIPSSVLNKFNATTSPTVNDDSGDGYAVGSMWVDITADEVFVCVDASSGAAVWNGPFETGGALGPATVSGGTETDDGTFQYNAFTTDGTLTCSVAGVATILLVGAGGGGGGFFSGGGGGGGAVMVITDFPLEATTYAAVIGAGGAVGLATSGDDAWGRPGEPTLLGTVLAAPGGGGGGGIRSGSSTTTAPKDGASGGGGGGRNSNVGGAPWLAALGNAGGTARAGTTANTGAGGGGGGAGGAGVNASGDTAGAGGAGLNPSGFDTFGASSLFGGGGGGGSREAAGGGVAGAGGTGGGGAGGAGSGANGSAGTANTGGGGGGGGNTGSTGSTGGVGGSGIVVVRTPL